MKTSKELVKKLKWNQFYDPNFDWSDPDFYENNKLSKDFIRELKNEILFEN